ncbi:mannan endo-1,4-beta-mannosidase [Paenibacillus endophyticus]|uniref:Mannan endo-1,4-beta-mannosidase n=1 Tax=Paenibacillus endophyticus TaxID=1294268 RepID=A0A7W5CDQ0_9BACL|nr:glycosyl hydrolase [Paenibacillus endophyticus]MBB3155807.1 mannan endo-1,4-beta-mannosidase [Paenibacillus endophyticus]
MKNKSRLKLLKFSLIHLLSLCLLISFVIPVFAVNNQVANTQVSVVGNKIEVEDGVMTGTVSVDNTTNGYSGRGYAAFKGEGDLTLTYQAPNAGLYEITVGYNSPFGSKKTELIVNGQGTGEISLAQSTGFQEVSAGKVQLQSGDNTVKINLGWGWYNIDYIIVTSAEVGGSHQVEKILSNPNATPETQALMNYLVDTYGNGIISGQQERHDADWIYDQTGKYPALLGLDMMDYSPSRVEHGTSSQTIEQALDWGQQGGIVQIHWHWNAPKDLLDEPGNEWWSGFYTRATTFDVAYALEHPDSEDYQLLLRDIDVISNQLKRLQDAHIPVIWRPLHEAEGGWFWWGTKGPEAYKELYRLMYDRMKNVHGLNNLIWVFNSESEEWYPGDDVVDIVTTDYYAPNGDYNPLVNKYDQLVSLVNGTKLVALAENGPIPDPDLLPLLGADWLYFMTWTGNSIRDGLQNDPQHLQKVYHSDYVITRDELPTDLYSYGLAPVAEVSYSKTGLTNQDVVATITTNKQVTITNNDGKSSYTFANNGSFTFEFVDQKGLEGTVVATVNNIDKIPPTLKVFSDKRKLTKNNHKLEEVAFSWEAEDSDSGIGSVKLVSVTSNEPDNGSGDGNTTGDIQGAEIGTSDNKILLRAERSGNGSGRVYTVTYEAVDHAGNKTQASATVSVPHNGQ